MPTVKERVLSAISRASGVPVQNLEGKQTLKGDLVISHQSFVVLAQDLRAIIQDTHASETLWLKDIETAAATVDSVVRVVQEKSRP